MLPLPRSHFVGEDVTHVVEFAPSAFNPGEELADVPFTLYIMKKDQTVETAEVTVAHTDDRVTVESTTTAMFDLTDGTSAALAVGQYEWAVWRTDAGSRRLVRFGPWTVQPARKPA